MEHLEQSRFETSIEVGDDVIVTNSRSPFYGYDGTAVALVDEIDSYWLVQFPWCDRIVADVISAEDLIKA